MPHGARRRARPRRCALSWRDDGQARAARRRPQDRRPDRRHPAGVRTRRLRGCAAGDDGRRAGRQARSQSRARLSRRRGPPRAQDPGHLPPGTVCLL